LLKFLQSHYADFQIQTVRVPEYSLIKHHVLESNTCNDYVNHIERTELMHISHKSARGMLFLN